MSKQAKSPAEVPEKYVQCRAFRCQWRHVNDRATFGTGGQVVEFVRTSQCVVCKGRTHVTYSVPDFRVIKRRYERPDLYSVKGGYSVFDARGDYVKHRLDDIKRKDHEG